MAWRASRPLSPYSVDLVVRARHGGAQRQLVRAGEHEVVNEALAVALALALGFGLALRLGAQFLEQAPKAHQERATEADVQRLVCDDPEASPDRPGAEHRALELAQAVENGAGHALAEEEERLDQARRLVRVLGRAQEREREARQHGVDALVLLRRQLRVVVVGHRDGRVLVSAALLEAAPVAGVGRVQILLDEPHDKRRVVS